MRRSRPILPATILALAIVTSACAAPDVTRPEHDLALTDHSPAIQRRAAGRPQLSIVRPQPGEVVTSPVAVEVALENFALAPKGVSRDGEGHFHVIVDGACVTSGEVIEDRHHHVGTGAAVTEIELEPGTHRLCLQLGDGFHTALSISDSVVIEVE